MPTIGNLAVTFNDLRKRQAPDGAIDKVIEILQQSNPVMEDIRWAQGNLPTGNQTTQRNGLPEIHLRQINKGVKPSKSSTKQVVDTCCLLEARSKVDVALANMQPDPAAFRASEDKAFVEAMGEKVASYIFYGDSMKNMDEFNGLSVRYGEYGGEKHDASYQVINAGGTGKGKLSSAYLVGWGDNGAMGIYPKFGYAGLRREDKGVEKVIDSDGGEYDAYTTLFTWMPGLAIKDPEMVAAVRNIDLGALSGDKATMAQKKNVVDSMIRAQGRMRRLTGDVRPVWYVSPELYTFLTLYLNDKNNVYITRKELADGIPILAVNGIIVKKEDALLDTEDAVAEKK